MLLRLCGRMTRVRIIVVICIDWMVRVRITGLLRRVLILVVRRLGWVCLEVLEVCPEGQVCRACSEVLVFRMAQMVQMDLVAPAVPVCLQAWTHGKLTRAKLTQDSRLTQDKSIPATQDNKSTRETRERLIREWIHDKSILAWIHECKTREWIRDKSTRDKSTRDRLTHECKTRDRWIRAIHGLDRLFMTTETRDSLD
jgi:hypothetical protein